MQKFRVRNIQLLVATDVAARGLDVDDLTHVINYNLPDDNEIYTHRSGRTGRAGKKGISISLLHVRDKHNLNQIERIVKRPFKAIQIPTGSEICGKQLFHWIKKLETVVTEHQEIEKFLPEITEKLSGLDREELLRRVVSLQFGKFLDDYRSGEEIFSPLDRGGDSNYRSDDRRGGRREYTGNYKRLFINLGKTDGFFPEQLIELVNKNTSKKVPLGKIDLLKTFSFFEVEAEYADYLIEALNNSKFNDRRVAVEIAQEKTEGGHREKDRSEKRPAKWSDRKPDKGRGDKHGDRNRDFKKDKKYGKKDKKKYSR
jgi:ATP-dependent RNA helicase DeaD